MRSISWMRLAKWYNLGIDVNWNSVRLKSNMSVWRFPTGKFKNAVFQADSVAIKALCLVPHGMLVS
jgi:hypothetical protein